MHEKKDIVNQYYIDELYENYSNDNSSKSNSENNKEKENNKENSNFFKYLMPKQIFKNMCNINLYMILLIILVILFIYN